jgi:hypothetical protein
VDFAKASAYRREFQNGQERTRRKGNAMPTKFESKDIEQILAEADQLIQRINSDVLGALEEEHRLELEIQTQKLRKIKAEVEAKIGKKTEWTIGSAADGMHAAFLEIVKATKELKKYLS